MIDLIENIVVSICMEVEERIDHINENRLDLSGDERRLMCDELRRIKSKVINFGKRSANPN